MRSLAFAIVLPLIVTAALAQTPEPSTPTGPSAKSNQGSSNPQALQQQVRENLQQAGFTDIKMMPSSFLVRAKDKQGNPVMMVINPDSVTAVTEIPAKSATTGQASPAQQGGKDVSPEQSPAGK